MIIMAICSTLVLTDVFEYFAEMCLNIYGIDPSYYYSTPGLSWNACLKKTEVKLELLTDIDMLLMIERNINGAICQATHTYDSANNKYMKN